MKEVETVFSTMSTINDLEKKTFIEIFLESGIICTKFIVSFQLKGQCHEIFAPTLFSPN